LGKQINRKILLASRPKGMPTEENFQFAESDIPVLEDGQVLIRSLYVSVDPYMRGRMNDAKSYIAPYALNEVITGGVVGQIIESRHPNFSAGEFVSGEMGWQEYNVSDGKGLAKLDPNRAPITTALGVVGMPGLTAYFGLLDIGNPQPGETVVVSGAAGAVGSVVGQIAKIKGCRVVGIAGGAEKARYLTEELGFDAAIDYKATDNIRQALKETCPNGIDVYFDNVGGTITDAVMTRINFRARIVICGQIALYNLDKPDLGPRPFTPLLINSAMAKGFIVSDYRERFKEGFVQLAQWVQEGKLKYRETIVEGFENIPKAFLGLFRGENIGKLLVKVAEPQV
jgi:NADPH-dependent curcumin reductase CurA